MASSTAIELATLQGWTDIVQSDNIEYFQDGRTQKVCYGLPPGMTERACVPDVDTDPADCLELLRYMLTLKLYDQYPIAVALIEHRDGWYVRFDAKQPFVPDPSVMIGTGDSWHGEGETLELAIAAAALAALKEVQK